MICAVQPGTTKQQQRKIAAHSEIITTYYNLISIKLMMKVGKSNDYVGFRSNRSV